MSGLTSEILFEKFEILEVLKKDEHAAVFLANHIYLSKKIILKILNTEKMPDPSIVERFKREAKILAKLDYPHIIKVMDFGMSKEYFYISFEYIEGESLRNIFKTKNLLSEQKDHLMIQLLKGMNYAHANQIIHRDIKPENIFVDKNLNLKLGDFGLALSAEDNFVTNPYSIVGTPSYMSPEQVRGAKLTPQSDLFSAGVVLFELYTGKNPFLKENVNLTLNEINSYDENIIEEKLSDVREPIKQIIIKLLRKNVNQRYGSAGEILEVLNVQSEQPTIVITSTGYDKKKTKLVLMIIGLIVLIVVGIFIIEKPVDQKNTNVLQDKKSNQTQSTNPLGIETNQADSKKTEPEQKTQPEQIETDKINAAPLIQQNQNNSLPVQKNLGYGSLVVDIKPWAQVYIDNEDFGTTPLRAPIKLAEGDYTIKLVHPDYPTSFRSITIKPGQITNYRANLDTTISFIRCNINPWGNVYVNGNLKAEAQRSSLIKVNPGFLRLMVRNPYYNDVDTSFSVRRGDTLRLNFSLKKK
jgi:eukaryotic-like serine/threonine-protein kinase